MLAEEAKKFLERLSRHPSKSLSELSPLEARKYVAGQAKLKFKNSATYLKMTDVVLTHQPKELGEVDVHTPLRFYRTTQNGESPALILYFHGGGFVTGNCDYVDALCRLIAEETRALVVSVDYHLAPEHPFPYPVYEGLSILRTLSHHTDAYRFDLDRVILMGDSAGANLAAAITNLAQSEFSLYAQILFYPIADFAGEYLSHESFKEGYFLTKANMDWAKKHYLQDLKNAADPMASPILNNELSQVPKTLIITAECDPLRDEGRAYAEHLIQFGREVSYHEFPGMIHCFATFPDFFPINADKAIKEVIKFLVL